jgi:hypothetical protein
MLRREALARQHGEGVLCASSATRWWCDAIIFRRIGAMPRWWCDAIIFRRIGARPTPWCDAIIMERVGVKPKNVVV